MVQIDRISSVTEDTPTGSAWAGSVAGEKSVTACCEGALGVIAIEHLQTAEAAVVHTGLGGPHMDGNPAKRPAMHGRATRSAGSRDERQDLRRHGPILLDILYQT